MKAGLQLRLSQHLTLTPQLQQSIRLLQLSTLELQQEIQSALAENPLLELADGEGDDSGGNEDAPELFVATVDREQMLDGSDAMAAFSAADHSDAREVMSPSIAAIDTADAGSIDGQFDAVDTGATLSTTTESSGESDGEFDVGALDFGEWGSSGAGSFDDDDESFESQRESAPSLREHLRLQLALVKSDPAILALVHGLIDCLDEHGFLSACKSDIDALLMRDGSGSEVSDADWKAAIAILQSLDPAGVGASDLRECLLLQLKQCPNNGDTKLARRIVSEALEHLGKRDYLRIKKLLDIDDIDLKDAHAVIRTLTPRPGASFADVSATLMIPDIIVRRSKRRWVAELNPVAVPKLTVNSVYADMLHRQKEGRSTPLSTQLQEARWLG
jgi:RNA polymerase sigma-54 factor